MVNKLTVKTPYGAKIEYYVAGERIWTEYAKTADATTHVAESRVKPKAGWSLFPFFSQMRQMMAA